MKVYLFLLVLFQSLLQAKCQSIVWEQDRQLLPIGLSVSIFEDKSQRLRIDEVSSAIYSSKFKLSNQSILHFGFTNSVYWLRFEMKNHSMEKLFLSLDQAFLPDATLYSNTNYEWGSMSSGYKVPLQQKAVIDHFQVFPLMGEHAIYYLRLKPYIHAVPIQIVESNYWHMESARQKINIGIYAGILLFAVIINLFLFISLRKTYFLNYAILVFFYLLTSALVMEGYAVYFFPGIDLMFWYKIVPVLDMPAFLFYCISFFELKKKHGLVYKISLYSALFFIGYLFSLSFLPLLIVLLINQIFALLVFVLGIYIGVVVGRSGNTLGYYFAVAYCIWFVLILVEAIYIQTGMPKHFSSLSYVSTAVFIEAFLLAFLQAKRFEWERKKDHLKQFEMKNRIDKMEQDFQHEILNTKLEIQEQTFNTISQEIHDNVGQLLSLAKIQVNIMQQKEDKDHETITELKENVGIAMNELRNIAKNLSNHYIINNSLQETVANQAQRINRLGLVKITIEVYGVEKRLNDQKKIVLYRIIQESIQNIIKHAKASKVGILFDYTETIFHIKITDNGIGFNKVSMLQQKDGLGLQNVTSRAELIGGKAIINSIPDQGTTIQIFAPYV